MSLIDFIFLEENTFWKKLDLLYDIQIALWQPRPDTKEFSLISMEIMSQNSKQVHV